MTARAHSLSTLAAALLLAGCGGGMAAPEGGPLGDAGDGAIADGGVPEAGDGPDGGRDAPAPGGYSLPEFAGGVSFYLALPPAFSPFLPPSGDEATREPATFYDQTSDYYFSYGLVWWLTGTPDLSTAALRDDLRTYYLGLCDATTPPAVTLQEPAPAGSAIRSGTLDVGNGQPGICFGNPVPPATIEVATYACPDHAAVVLLLSPQPQSSQVWTELRAIRDGFLCW